MSFDAHTNLAYSTVATAPSPASSGTSLVVATGQGSRFPAAPFNATVWPANAQPTPANAEIVRVTNVSTDTFTITRAQESTSARSIGVGDQIAATITAKTITDIEKAAGLLHTVASSGASLAVDYSTASTWDITLTAACTLTLTGFTNGDPDFLTLILRQDGTGSRAVTWPTITWIGTGLAPTLQTAASSVDSVVLFSVDGGSTVYGIAQTSASGLRSGTSFPGSPSDGDLFYRSDRDILYFYKSAISKWLSVSLHEVTAGNVAGASSPVGVGSPVPIDTDIYVENWVVSVSVSTTNNGSNYWTLRLYYNDHVGGSNFVSSFTTAADTASRYTLHKVSIATVFDAATYTSIYTSATVKTGSPGAISAQSKFLYRTVG